MTIWIFVNARLPPFRTGYLAARCRYCQCLLTNNKLELGIQLSRLIDHPIVIESNIKVEEKKEYLKNILNMIEH